MIYKGLPVFPGLTSGEVFLYKPDSFPVSERHILSEEVPAAISEYHACIEQVREDLERLCLMLSESPDQAKIFSAHINVLEDEVINDEIRSMIENAHVSPDWAVYSTYESYIQLLAASENPIIAERADDLRDVCSQILRCFSREGRNPLTELDRPVILIAHNLSPSETVLLDRSKVLAIVTETGGLSSHSAILSRSYGIPALIGVEGIVDGVATGQIVVVDTHSGTIDTAPDAAALEAARRAAQHSEEEKLENGCFDDAVTRDGVRIDLKLNLASADHSELEYAEGFDGVGLFRTEFLYMDHLPSEEEQFEIYKRVLATVNPHPVVLRTLDIGGDKNLPYFKTPKEDNPFLGRRGLRLSLANAELFRVQLRAALRAAVYGELWLMFPMVSCMEDLYAAKNALEEAGKSLEREEVAYGKNVKVGIMIETPAIAMIAEHVAGEVDFASIGTNDLTQYVCAADRMNSLTAPYYQQLHPSMLRLIRYVSQQFRLADKPLSVCGEMAGNPTAAAALLGCGIRSLSISAPAQSAVRKMIRSITLDKAQTLSAAACDISTAAEVESYLCKAVAAAAAE